MDGITAIDGWAVELLSAKPPCRSITAGRLSCKRIWLRQMREQVITVSGRTSSWAYPRIPIRTRRAVWSVQRAGNIGHREDCRPPRFLWIRWPVALLRVRLLMGAPWAMHPPFPFRFFMMQPLIPWPLARQGDALVTLTFEVTSVVQAYIYFCRARLPGAMRQRPARRLPTPMHRRIWRITWTLIPWRCPILILIFEALLSRKQRRIKYSSRLMLCLLVLFLR